MTTLERLTADLTTSMKARDAFRTNTLRQVIAAVRAAEKSGTAARELSDDEVQAVLASEVKKRRDTAGIYAGAGADDRAANETAEADLVETYLPAAVTEAQLDAVVADAIASTGASTMKDMGAVMKAATAAASGLGRVDGKQLSGRVRAALSGPAAG
ncbi:GatB/YqeY domain-containing protein [Cellulomonas sp. ATA003]|uniref:GatB/YqeY domain-containing protein n=1 Tax=Cellulomonas sp. ATA003 TaxID=3073064 RepID=UPI002872C629|nr:GatB/YqeY domain-containing protein [Cellulomonas sp. ATA003]WNB86235.1 GatB/YqeY domain-containing protein [Cellulomonas sp. ATA003]